MESLVLRVATLWGSTDATREILSLMVTLENEQHIEVPEAVVRWSRGQEFAVENVMIEPHTHARLQHYVKRLVQSTHETLSLERSETYG